MQDSFEPSDFVTRVGRHLVLEFEDASLGSTAGLIGGAREHPARRQFERLLPGVAGVGTGVVLDSERCLSRQQDMVVYERHLCPVFSVNDTPEATYFPVEGVVAAGEVKSRLGNAELENAFAKIVSVKRLRRHAVATNDGFGTPAVAYRHYGSAVSYAATPKDQYDQNANPRDQVFGFILCHTFAMKNETLLTRARELWDQTPPECGPNVIVSLSDGFLQPAHWDKERFADSQLGADSVALCASPERGFAHLVQDLNRVLRTGRTVPVGVFDRYFSRQTAKPERLDVTFQAFEQGSS